MDAGYRDRWIECGPDGLRIRGYYFPLGTKVIPYDRIRSIQRVNIGPLTGRWRIWGTANPRYWASLDPQRPKKKVGFILDVGRFTRPFITPDDPDALEAAIRAHTKLGPPAEGNPPLLL